MLGSAWLRLGLVLAAAGFIALVTMPAMGSEPRAYGQQLLAQYRLPPETIARYAALAAGTAGDALAREDSRFADRSPWVGPARRAGVGQNPYTLVLTVSGVARTAGEVVAQWQAGWELRESPLASRELVMAVPRITKTGQAAGQALTLTASSARVSFRGERTVAPMLGLVQMRNLDISDVQLQVWSGDAPQAWPALPWPRAALLTLGLLCLLIGLSFKWQRAERAEQADAALPLHRVLPPPVPAAPPTQSVGFDKPSGFSERAEPPEPAVTADGSAPAAAAPSQAARVMAALHQVLTVGLDVPTVFDEERMNRQRKKR